MARETSDTQLGSFFDKVDFMLDLEFAEFRVVYRERADRDHDGSRYTYIEVDQVYVGKTRVPLAETFVFNEEDCEPYDYKTIWEAAMYAAECHAGR